MDNERIYICANWCESNLLPPSVKKSFCADCGKNICVSPSTIAYEGAKRLICFDCHIERISQAKEIILAVTPEAITELREFLNYSNN